MKWTMSIAAVILAAAACTDVEAPARIDIYEFRHPDGFVFNWPADRQPVRIWVDPRAGMPQKVVEGAVLWLDALLYDELRAALVTDSNTADIIVRLIDDPPPNFFPPGLPNESPPCNGVSEASFSLADSTTIIVNGKEVEPLQLTGPIRVSVGGKPGRSSGDVQRCLQIVVAHEMGHAFGILAHSSDTTDLMFGVPQRRFLTERDRETFQVLYHTTPSIRPHDRQENQ